MQRQQKIYMREMPAEVVGRSFVFEPSDHCRNLRIRSRYDSSAPPFHIQRADAPDLVKELDDIARRIREAYDIRDLPDNLNDQDV